MTDRYSPVEISLDKEADAAYVALSDAPIARTVEVTDRVFVDLDEMAVVVGVEVLGLATEIPFDRLADFHVRSEVIDLLRLIKPSDGAIFVANTCADLFATPRTTVHPQGWNPGIPQSRMVRLTDRWRTCWGTTVSLDTLTAHPPQIGA